MRTQEDRGWYDPFTTTFNTPFKKHIWKYKPLEDIIKTAQVLVDTAKPSYPFYNIIKNDDYDYIVEFSLSGFDKDDLTITTIENILTVEGKISTPETEKKVNYIHHGIARRSFSRKIHFSDIINVTDAKMSNGILTISVEVIQPESKKPVSVEIKKGK
jgi:molecular chaperone IbpA